MSLASSTASSTARSVARSLPAAVGGGIPAIALVSQNVKNGTQASGTTNAIDTTSADLLVDVAGWLTGASVMTDSKSNSLTKLTQRNVGSQWATMWYGYPTSLGSGHTVTQSVGSYCSLGMLAFKNTLVGASFDQSSWAVAAPTATTLACGSLSPTVPNSLVVTIAAIYDNTVEPTYPTGFTGYWAPYSAGNALALAVAWKVLTNEASVNPTWSWTKLSNAVVYQAIFKPRTS